MLKLKKNIKYIQLEKLGYVCTPKEIYWSLRYKRIIINRKNRVISINRPCNLVYDKLFELIEMGFVEVARIPNIWVNGHIVSKNRDEIQDWLEIAEKNHFEFKLNWSEFNDECKRISKMY